MEDEELHIAASANSLHATSKSMKNKDDEIRVLTKMLLHEEDENIQSPESG